MFADKLNKKFRAVSLRQLFAVAFIMILITTVPLSAEQADDSIRLYELGISLSMMGKLDKAHMAFQRSIAAGGEGAEYSQIEMIRYSSRNNASVSRLREMIASVKSEENQSIGWIACLQGLKDSRRTDDFVDIALEFVTKNPNNERADDALLLLSWIYIEEKAWVSAIETIAKISEDYSQSDSIDDALYLNARICLEPGPYYNPRKGRELLQKFWDRKNIPPYRESVWLESVKTLYLQREL